MSQENVEVVRRAFEASGRRDTAAVLALDDAEVEWDASRAQGLEGAVYRGHDGLSICPLSVARTLFTG
jgi:ketosteroid isomerase-like protein